MSISDDKMYIIKNNQVQKSVKCILKNIRYEIWRAILQRYVWFSVFMLILSFAYLISLPCCDVFCSLVRLKFQVMLRVWCRPLKNIPIEVACTCNSIWNQWQKKSHSNSPPNVVIQFSIQFERCLFLRMKKWRIFAPQTQWFIGVNLTHYSVFVSGHSEDQVVRGTRDLVRGINRPKHPLGHVHLLERCQIQMQLHLTTSIDFISYFLSNDFPSFLIAVIYIKSIIM